MSFISFHYSCLFSLLNYVYRYYIVFRGTDGLMEGYDKGTGPNDARHVVWALGDFSFSLFVFIFFTKVCLLYFRYFGAIYGPMGGYDEGNGPKRCVLRHLGTRCFFFFDYSSLFP